MNYQTCIEGEQPQGHLPNTLRLEDKVLQVLTGKAARTALLFTGGVAMAFAQTSPFGQVATGSANEAVLIAKWVGIILCIFCGFGLMAGGPGALAKASGLFIGLVFALFATPIITWVQGL